MDVLSEPIEHVVIDVPEEFAGAVIENLGRRKGEMKNMISTPAMAMRSEGADGEADALSGGYRSDNVRLEFLVPSRGLIGFRGEFVTQTRGTGILHSNFSSYEPFKGELPERTHGALVAMEAGESVPYGMFRLQDRGTFFIEPNTRVYAGMVVGENAREGDIPVNVCKTKQLTNVRAAGSDEAVRLEPPHILTLELSFEWLGSDVFLEVTPKSLRIRKRYLDPAARARAEKRAAAAGVPA
jgi:GTP-binding protein